jgi:hypothetical protein
MFLYQRYNQVSVLLNVFLYGPDSPSHTPHSPKFHTGGIDQSPEFGHRIGAERLWDCAITQPVSPLAKGSFHLRRGLSQRLRCLGSTTLSGPHMTNCLLLLFFQMKRGPKQVAGRTQLGLFRVQCSTVWLV